MSPISLCLVEPKLDSFIGHRFNYNNSIYQAARALGLSVRVLAGKEHLPEIAAAMPVEPVFDANFRPFRTGFRLFDFFGVPLQQNWRIYRDLVSMPGPRPGAGSVVFFGDAAIWNLAGFALWMRRFPAEDAPAFVLLLRYSYCYGGRPSRASRWLLPGLRLVERLSSRYRISLVTDSARLAVEYRKFTALPLTVLPIPHTGGYAGGAAAADGAVQVLSLGSARDNKGFDLLAGAIGVLNSRRELERLRFRLQCYMLDSSPGMEGPVAMLKRLALPEVELVEETVDERRYREMLCGCGAVVLPYRTAEYAANTSGIFTEALAAGKPVIVTSGTWMADQLSRFGAGVTFRDGDTADLARAILELRDNYARLAAQAAERAAAWTAYHSPENFMRELLKAAGGK